MRHWVVWSVRAGPDRTITTREAHLCACIGVFMLKETPAGSYWYILKNTHAHIYTHTHIHTREHLVRDSVIVASHTFILTLTLLLNYKITVPLTVLYSMTSNVLSISKSHHIP